MASVHIVGAGLAGLAAANTLADSGMRVCLYESTAQAGGRCRSYDDPILGRTIDNGNHLIVGANQHAHAFIEQIGAQDELISPGTVYPFIDLKFGKKWSLKPPFFVPALPMREYMRFMKLCTSGRKRRLTMCINPKSDLYRFFVEPLCVSALNTQPDDASSVEFRKFMMKTVMKGAKAMKPYVPRANWQQSLIDPALKRLKSYDMTAYYQHSIKSISTEDDRATSLSFTRTNVEIGDSDAVILATPALVTGKLLDMDVPDEFNAIINGHFIYDHGQPEGSFMGTIGGMAHWIFFKDGVISTTTSAANDYLDKEVDDIANTLWANICTALNINAELPTHRIVTEKRATFSCCPDQLLKRPRTNSRLKNLFLAGDYTATGLPATIDGAVKSGQLAAKAAIECLK